MVEGGGKVVEGGRKVVGRWSEGGWQMVGRWLKVVERWFWFHKIVFTGGPDPPLFLGGFQPPRPPGGGLQAPRAPAYREAPPLGLSVDLGTKILVPRSWYQDLGTKILLPRSCTKILVP